jgi:hypothetical protein
MGPTTYGRGSIVVKLEARLNDATKLQAMYDLLTGGPTPADAAEVRRVVDALTFLSIDERTHLSRHYFKVNATGAALAKGLHRFDCYRSAFLSAFDAVWNQDEYHIAMDWGCGQIDACVVTWEDSALGRALHLRIMSSLPGSSMKPSAPALDAVPTATYKRRQGVLLHAVSGSAAAAGSTWNVFDLNDDPQLGNGR